VNEEGRAMINPPDALSLKVELNVPLETAIAKVTEALQAEGFGVLTRVDMHQAFQEKLGFEFHPYAILGACNPSLAYAAISSRPEAGLLLPCNVTVEEITPAKSLVRIVDPEAMLRAVGSETDPAMASVGTQAAERLRRVAESLGT